MERKVARIVVKVVLDVDLAAMGEEYGKPAVGYWNAVDMLRNDITEGLKGAPYGQALLRVDVR